MQTRSRGGDRRRAYKNQVTLEDLRKQGTNIISNNNNELPNQLYLLK